MFNQFKFVLPCLAAILACVKAARDATLEEGAVDKEVADAVLRKLRLSKIFPDDHSFLIRLAYTETRFGESNKHVSYPRGGIWAVDESVYKLTKSANLSSQHNSVARKFQINWQNTEWRDLKKPMYSGIAAALYFTLVKQNQLGASIPQKIENQAEHWRQYYRPLGNPSQFINDADKLLEESKCRGKFHLCIVLDSSGSIGEPNYKVATNFIGNMIQSFSGNFTRFGMLIYSDYTKVIFRVKNTYTKVQLASMARVAPYHAGWTHTHLGILEAITLLKEADDDTDGIPKIITVFTDGQSNGDPAALENAIKSMKVNRIKPLSIGIGSGIRESELRLIARNDPASVFMLQDFTALQSFLQQFSSLTCEIPQTPKLNKKYHDILNLKEIRNYKIASPPEGITPRVKVIEGDIKGYWSYSIPVPTEVLNDGVIEGPTFIPAPSGIVRRRRESEGEEPLTNIYITIQGVEPRNNYTLLITEGNQAPNEATATTFRLATIMAAVVELLHPF